MLSSSMVFRAEYGGACREQAHDPAPKQASNLTEYMEEVEIGEQSKEGGRERERKDGSGWARSVAGGGAGVAVGGLATRQVSTIMYVVGTFGAPSSSHLLALAFFGPFQHPISGHMAATKMPHLNPRSLPSQCLTTQVPLPPAPPHPPSLCLLHTCFLLFK